MSRDRRAPLECGHEFRVPELGMPPREGSFVTCPDGCLEGPKRVIAVRGVPVVYVQDAMW